MRRDRPRRPPDQAVADLPVPVLLGAAAALAALAVAGPVLGAAGPVDARTAAVNVAFALSFTPLGVFVLRRLPDHPLGRLMLLGGGAAVVATLATAWSVLPPAQWLAEWTWTVPYAVVPVLLLLAPDGRLPSRRWRAPAVVLVGAVVVATVAFAAAAALAPTDLLRDPEAALPDPVRVLVLVFAGAWAVVLACGLGVLGSLVGRWRRAERAVRGQLACLAPVPLLLLVGIALDLLEVPYGWVPAILALPLALTLAVLRHQMHDLDLHVHRGAVWLALTALGLAAYVAVATGVGALVAGGPTAPVASVLAAGTVAALLLPAQRWVGRGVDRLLYGRRDEPYAVLTALGRHLGSVRDPLAVLPEIAATVVDGLRVPYAAVRVSGAGGEDTTVVESGRWSGPPERFPMVAHGEPVGELLVAARRPGERFTAAETRLLTDLAGQAALAAEACRSAFALRAARDRLVLAREEERRRLRRDLHDGVASALVGTRMLTEVARRTVAADTAAAGLLADLAADLDTCAAEVRELIDGLRPAALDDGLAAALKGVVERAGGHGPRVELDVVGDLGELPAAVEVAAFRAVTEALTNVLKHAGASLATVRVQRDERHLAVQVSDDGRGFTPAPDGRGVGLSSLRERAEELGGTCEVGSSPSGTTVALLLPVGT